MNSPYLCTLFSSRMFSSVFHEEMQLNSHYSLVCQFYINSLSFLTLFLPNTGDFSDGFITAFFFPTQKRKAAGNYPVLDHHNIFVIFLLSTVNAIS